MLPAEVGTRTSLRLSFRSPVAAQSVCSWCLLDQVTGPKAWASRPARNAAYTHRANVIWYCTSFKGYNFSPRSTTTLLADTRDGEHYAPRLPGAADCITVPGVLERACFDVLSRFEGRGVTLLLGSACSINKLRKLARPQPLHAVANTACLMH
jgi:hypothetical protein